MKLATALRFCVPLAAFGLLNAYSQQIYIERSRAVTPGSFTQIPFISSSHALRFFEERRRAWTDTVYSESLNYSAARIQSYYVNPAQIIYLSKDPYIPGGSAALSCPRPCLFPASWLFASTDRRTAERVKLFRKFNFRFFPGTRSDLLDRFDYDSRAIALQPNFEVIQSLRESVLNNWPGGGPPSGALYRVRTVAQSKNRLVYVPGSLGQTFATGNRVSLFALEDDSLYHGRPLAAIGRYLLFRVLAPSRRIRFEFSMTNTLRGSGTRSLPKAVIVGQKRAVLSIVGRGAARVFSGVLLPQFVGGMRFLGLDMGENETPINEPPRTNLMLLYGRKVRLDVRNITVFARDISVVDDKQYRRRPVPRQISHFPTDLANPNLEFSGLYEDGWMSEDAYFVLQSTAQDQVLRFRGLVPLIKNRAFNTTMCVTIDGAVPFCQPIGVGYFNYAFELGRSKAFARRVRIHFGRYQILPRGDRRPIGMRLLFAGFE